MRLVSFICLSAICFLPTALAVGTSSNSAPDDVNPGGPSVSKETEKEISKQEAKKQSNLRIWDRFHQPFNRHGSTQDIQTLWSKYDDKPHAPAERYSEAAIQKEPRLVTQSAPQQFEHDPLVSRPGKSATSLYQPKELKLENLEDIKKARQLKEAQRKKFRYKLKSFGEILKQKLKAPKFAPRPVLRRRSQDLDSLSLQTLHRRDGLDMAPGLVRRKAEPVGLSRPALLRRRLRVANDYLL